MTGGVLGGLVGLFGGGPPGALLGGTFGATGLMFGLPIAREGLVAFRLERRLTKLVRSLRGKLSPGDTLTLKANGRTLEDLSVTIEPNSFPNRLPSTQTIQLDGLDATNIASEVQRVTRP